MPVSHQRKTAAYVAPLALFMVLNLVPGWVRIANPELPWFQRAPEHWLYPMQTLLCGALLLHFRREYQFGPWRGWGWATSLAAVGFLMWIAPAWWHDRTSTAGSENGWWQWFGVVERKDGFDPNVLAEFPGWHEAAIGMRFLRLVVIVPLVEELFWRGFLMRYLTAEDRPWPQVPFGWHQWRVFWIVTVLVMFAHAPADYAAAFAWGALVYFVAVRTKSLGACVFMHAVCNLLLGIYVMKTQSWGFW